MPTLDSTRPSREARCRFAGRTIEPVMRTQAWNRCVRRVALSPYPLWPTPAALSSTIRSGTPPSHSEQVAQRRACTQRSRPASTAPDRRVRIREIKHEMMHPLHHAAQQRRPRRNRPASHGCHTRSMNASSRSAANSRLSRATARVTVDRRPPRHARPSTAYRSRSRYAATCASSRDPPRACSITGRCRSITDARGFLPTARPTDPPSRSAPRTVGSRQ